MKFLKGNSLFILIIKTKGKKAPSCRPSAASGSQRNNPCHLHEVSLLNRNKKAGLFQSVNRTGFLALLAKDALSGVLSVSRIAVDFHIHWADLQAFAAMDAFFLIAFDAEPREVAHRFQEHHYGTNVFAEGAVVLK